MSMEMNYKDYEDAGKITFDALEHAKTLVKPGAKLLDVAESIEKFIVEKGMRPGFPVNISVNQKAAHYTPAYADDTAFSESDLVKVDVGARRNDGMGDCAITIDLSGRYAELVKTAQDALEAALSMVKASRQLNEIGRAVNEIAAKKGLKPIRNLGGHGIETGELHASIMIPNFDNGDTTKLEEGQVVAVETFITDGVGYVVDSDFLQIFQKGGSPRLRSEEARNISSFIDNNYSSYPFALRWLQKEFKSEFVVRRAISELLSQGALEPFPALVEKGKGMVAQAEAEVIIEKDSCRIITK